MGLESAPSASIGIAPSVAPSVGVSLETSLSLGLGSSLSSPNAFSSLESGPTFNSLSSINSLDLGGTQATFNIGEFENFNPSHLVTDLTGGDRFIPEINFDTAGLNFDKSEQANNAPNLFGPNSQPELSLDINANLGKSSDRFSFETPKPEIEPTFGEITNEDTGLAVAEAENIIKESAGANIGFSENDGILAISEAEQFLTENFKVNEVFSAKDEVLVVEAADEIVRSIDINQPAEEISRKVEEDLPGFEVIVDTSKEARSFANEIPKISSLLDPETIDDNTPNEISLNHISAKAKIQLNQAANAAPADFFISERELNPTIKVTLNESETGSGVNSASLETANQFLEIPSPNIIELPDPEAIIKEAKKTHVQADAQVKEAEEIKTEIETDPELIKAIEQKPEVLEEEREKETVEKLEIVKDEKAEANRFDSKRIAEDELARETEERIDPTIKGEILLERIQKQGLDLQGKLKGIDGVDGSWVAIVDAVKGKIFNNIGAASSWLTEVFRIYPGGIVKESGYSLPEEKVKIILRGGLDEASLRRKLLLAA